MSDLNYSDKRKIEALLGMVSGHVGNFNNSCTFADFISASTVKNIGNEQVYGPGSKANRIRAFWRVEPNFIVSMLLKDLIELYGERLAPRHPVLLEECSRIATRLRRDGPVAEPDAHVPAATKGNFEQLARGSPACS